MSEDALAYQIERTDSLEFTANSDVEEISHLQSTKKLLGMAESHGSQQLPGQRSLDGGGLSSN